MRPRLSVVVPVYNVEKYLDECLTSLLNQDQHDFEAICVNDGSTDGSREILARWEENVPWLHVIDQPNGGLSSARNTGMKAAQGDYICFLDSDDRLLPQTCRRIIEVFDASESEVVIYGGYALPREAASYWLEQTLCTNAISYGGPCEELLFSPDTRPFAWRTALTRKIFERENLLFDEEVGYGEDQVFQFALYARSHRTTVIDDRLYEYRVNREGSLMSDAHVSAKELMLEHVNILRVVWNDYAKLGILGSYAHAMLSWTCSFVANDALMLDIDECNEVMDALGRTIREHWDENAVVAIHLEPCEEKVILEALSSKPISRAKRHKLFASLHRYLYGRVSTVKSFLHLK